MKAFSAAAALVFLSVFVFGCAAADDGESNRTADRSPAGQTDDQLDTRMTMNVISSGSYGKMAENIDSGGRSAPFIEVARNQSELASLWSQYIGEGERPEIDFEGSLVVFLLLPPQPTGGYGIEPNDTALSGRTLEVDATLHRPGQGQMVTQAFTAPYAVIEIEGVAAGVEKVVWMNQGRALATKIVE